MISYLAIAAALGLGFGLGFRFGTGVIENPLTEECVYLCPDGRTVSFICAKGEASEAACLAMLPSLCREGTGPVA